MSQSSSSSQSKKEARPSTNTSTSTNPPDEKHSLGYNVTGGGLTAVPKTLLGAGVAAISIEFLARSREETPDSSNHVVYKINLVPSKKGENIQCKAVRVGMEVDWDADPVYSNNGGIFHPGKMYVKPLQYSNKSKSSIRSFTLEPVKGVNSTLGQILEVLMRCKLHGFLFVFNTKTKQFLGCRDFV